MLIQIAVIATCLAMIGFTFWLGWHAGSWTWKEQYQDLIYRFQDNDSKWKTQYEELSHENFVLAETFDSRLERMTAERVEEKIRSWEPDFPSIVDDFKRAEAMADYMALKRETINAGRLTPPREDAGGEPAKVRKVSLGKGRRRSA